MATLVPTIATIASTLGTVKTVFDTVDAVSNRSYEKDRRKQSALALQQLRERQLLAEKAQSDKITMEKQEDTTQTSQAEELRKAALKRAMAKQTANFGGQGITASGGSSDAVLLGLYEESDAERARREELDNIKSKALDTGLENLKKQNLLNYQQTLDQYRLARLV